MDAKLTISFDALVIEKAKKFAEAQGLSLSRFIEILLRKATEGGYGSIENLPVADWVSKVAEGDPEYVTKPRVRKDMKEEFYKSRK
jgi:antitoxin component of RelBE/YafQ-DinJ toxin-antitoxin module